MCGCIFTGLRAIMRSIDRGERVEDSLCGSTGNR